MVLRGGRPCPRNGLWPGSGAVVHDAVVAAAGAGAAGAGAVPGEHLGGGPAVQFHQVPFGSAAVQPGVAEVVVRAALPSAVRCRANEPISGLSVPALSRLACSGSKGRGRGAVRALISLRRVCSRWAARRSAFPRLSGPVRMWLDAHGGLGLSACAQARQAVLLPPLKWCLGDHPPGRRHGSSASAAPPLQLFNPSLPSWRSYRRRRPRRGEPMPRGSWR